MAYAGLMGVDFGLLPAGNFRLQMTKKAHKTAG
jgi:hypothetical protein